ncbi:LysR substrate-binding domain-containing protein [Herminiimonas sp. NPDC097707]|uniref:LysR substrate-binding domain-containing protein n=1 Tax=Herminiimonas sp. NPDC097707 TaxID=3364007 RepID=UPI00383BAE5E
MKFNSSILTGLRCFEVAAGLLNFTKAAQALNLTQSAVSQQIRNLEGNLGYSLFVRQHRSLVLTDKGKVLFECASRTFLDIEQTLRRLEPSDTPLQVNCLPSFALQWLMPRLSDFQHLHPTIAVRLKAEFQTLDLHAMQADDIDVAIRFDPGQYGNLKADRILDEYLMPVATPKFLSEHPAFAAGQSLQGVTLLHDATPWGGAPEFIEWRTWMEAERPDWLSELGGIQFNLASLAIGAALNHQGVAMARTALVLDEIKSGRLLNVFGRLVSSPAHYILLTQRAEDRRTTVFSLWLKDECSRFNDERRQLLSI